MIGAQVPLIFKAPFEKSLFIFTNFKDDAPFAIDVDIIELILEV